MAKKKRYVIVPGNGDLCSRCGMVMEICEHVEITKKHRRQPFYYSRWFNCINPDCETNFVMPLRYRVWNSIRKRRRRELEAWMRKKARQEQQEHAVQEGLASGELVVWGDSWDESDTSGPTPWE
jgi:hypothetical protein